MTEVQARPPAKLEPVPAWTVLTDAPLRGISLAREAGVLLAWDEGDHLYLLDPDGHRRSTSRAPGRIIAGAIADDGSLIALAGERGRLWLLGPELELVVDRSTVPDALTLAIDPHGRYVVVSSKLSLNQVYNRNGKQITRFETRQALAHAVFIATAPLLIGTSANGTILGVELKPGGGSSGGLTSQLAWQQNLMSNVGRLAATGDGGMVLASCYTHGIQRYDLHGHNEGSYHVGGSASHAVPDFAGRTIMVSTLEAELAVLNHAGGIRWKTALPRPAVALEADALGRYLIYGMATGELTRLDLDGARRPSSATTATEPERARQGGGGSIRQPDWTVPVATADEDAQTAVLTVLDDPPRIGLITRTNRLQVFTPTGQKLGQAPELDGGGRFLRTCPGWIAAATDRQIVLYDARRNGAQRLNLTLIQITHLAIRPETFGVALVQESDRLGRATLAGQWAWHQELGSAVEDLAFAADGVLAATTGDGRLLTYGPSGKPLGTYQAEPPEPLLLVEAPDDSPDDVAWLTLARRRQVLRGHRRDGRAIWETPVPWEGWQLVRVGPKVVVAAPDGRALSYDGMGHLHAESRDGDPLAIYCVGPGGEAWRIVRQGVHLICTALDGRVNWRTVANEPLGPLAAGRAGVAGLIGRSLAWFGAPE